MFAETFLYGMRNKLTVLQSIATFLLPLVKVWKRDKAFREKIVVTLLQNHRDTACSYDIEEVKKYFQLDESTTGMLRELRQALSNGH